MSNNMRKLSLFLIVAVLFQLTSCGLVVVNYDKINGVEGSTSVSGDKPDVTEQPVKETEPPNVIVNDYTEIINSNLSSIPDKKYNNTAFKITTPDVSAMSENSDLDFLSEAAAKRNSIVESKHSVSIVYSKIELDVYYDEVNAAVNSGMYYSDLLILPQNYIASFATGGLIMNLRSMPSLDFDAPYFNKSSVSAASGGFNSYAISGPASLSPYSLPAVFFNADLLSNESDDLYSYAASGEWTWEKFFTTSLLAGTIESEEELFSWGTTTLGDAVYESAFVSSGMKIINSGIMKVPTLAFDHITSAPAVDSLKKLMAEPKSLGTSPDSVDLFKSGRVLFQFEKLSAITNLADSTIKWGILPLPKLTKSDQYVSLAGSDSLMFACPSTVATPEKSAVILMSLNAASDGVFKDGYINYLQYNYLRDNGSANMLELIIDGTMYDFSYTFGSLYAGIANGTYNMIRWSALPYETMEGLINAYKGDLDYFLSLRFGIAE